MTLAKAMISEDRLTKALTYLAETDVPAAEAKARMKAIEQRRKTIKGIEFLASSGTMAEKEAKAYKSEAYQSIVDEYESAVADAEIYANKRKTEELIIEVWRSVNSSRRKGNIV